VKLQSGVMTLCTKVCDGVQRNFARPVWPGNTFLGSTHLSVWFVHALVMAGQHGTQCPPDFRSAGSAETSELATSDGGGSRPVVCDHIQSRSTGPSALSDPEHSQDVHEQRKLSQRGRVVGAAVTVSAAVNDSHSVQVSMSVLSHGDHGGVNNSHSEYTSSASNIQSSLLSTSSRTPL